MRCSKPPWGSTSNPSAERAVGKSFELTQLLDTIQQQLGAVG
jgi:hypothetical protein